MWNDLDPVWTDDHRAARDQAHHALQLVSAAGYTHLAKDAGFEGSNVGWEDGVLYGQVLAPGVRVGLRISRLTWVVTSAGGSASRAAAGQTFAQAKAWLRARLVEAGLPDLALDIPDWEIPAGPSRGDDAFAEVSADALSTLSAWFDNAAGVIGALVASRSDAAKVRCWPHHFDIATLITLPSAGDTARTVGVGMTPGDGGIAEPYLYVSPWPYPATWGGPDLPAGHRNLEGWFGAVLSAGELPVDTQDAAVQGFVTAAVAAATDLAGAT